MKKYIAFAAGYYDRNDHVGVSAIIIYNEGGNELYRWGKARRIENPQSGVSYAYQQQLGACISALIHVPEGSELTIFTNSLVAVQILSGIGSPNKELALVEMFLGNKEKRNTKVVLEHVANRDENPSLAAVKQSCEEYADGFRQGLGPIFESGNITE